MVIAGVEQPGEFFAALFCILQTWIWRTNDFNWLSNQSTQEEGKKEERSVRRRRDLSYAGFVEVHDNLIRLCSGDL